MTAEVPPKLVCLGNMTIVDTILPDGTERAEATGGDAIYAALAAKLWQPSCEMVMPIGNDLPAHILQQIVGSGFSLDGLPQRPVPSMRYRATYHDQDNRQFEPLFPIANFHTLSPTPEDIPTPYRQADAFLVLAMTLEAQELLVDWLRSNTQALVALDLQDGYIPGNEDRVRRLCSKAEIFMPSKEEVRLIVGHENWRRAAEEFANAGSRIVVIKLGREGSLVHNAQTGEFFTIPAFPAPLVDATGAGDAYCGGFMASLTIHSADLMLAARAGAISASFAIVGFGIDGLLEADQAEKQRRVDRWDITT